MSIVNKKIINLCCVLLIIFAVPASATIDTSFVQYLANNAKHTELRYYLQMNDTKDVASNYQWAKYFLLTNQDSAFMQYFQKSKILFVQDTLAMGYVSCYFLQKNNGNVHAANWFAALQHYSVPAVQQIKNIYEIQLLASKNIQPNSYPNVLQESVLRYKKTASKNPTKAAILSAVIPGTGNLYTGQKHIAVQTFASTALFVGAATESVVKTKVNSALSIFTLFLGSLFYGSNVYGAYRDAQYFKQEHLQQLFLDAYNYYSTAYYPSLY
jgi:hypothetical protein